MPSNYFSGAGKAQVFQRGVYFNPDFNYKVKIKSTKVFQTRTEGDAFLGTFEVLESNDPKSPVGCERTWYQGLKDKNIAFGALKPFYYACVGLSLDNPNDAKAIAETDAELDDALQELVDTNSMKDTVLNLQTLTRMSKPKVDSSGTITKPSKAYTVHNWSGGK